MTALRKLRAWFMSAFRRPDPIAPATNRHERRTRQSIARRQRKLHTAQS